MRAGIGRGRLVKEDIITAAGMVSQKGGRGWETDTHDLLAPTLWVEIGPSVVTLSLNRGCVLVEELTVPTVSGENAVRLVDGVS